MGERDKMLYSRFERSVLRWLLRPGTSELSLALMLQLIARLRKEIEVDLLTPPASLEEQIDWYSDLCLQLLAEARSRQGYNGFAPHLYRLRRRAL